MFKKILYITIVLLNFSTMKAEIVKSIQISGNQRVSEETIKVYGEIEINKNYEESDLNNILQNLNATNFFEDIQIRINKNVLLINLKEYPVVSQLLLIGEPSKKYKEQIKKLMSSKEKQSFIKSNLSKDIDLIKNLYSTIGYGSSKIDAKIKKIDERSVELIIEIDRGNKTKISSIKFIGDKKVRDRRLRDIIVSEEHKFYKVISNNSNFSKTQIQLDLRLLTNYYKSVGYYDVKINSNSAEFNQEGNVDLIYSIDAGPRYTINKISTNADPVFDKDIFSPLKDSYKKYIGKYYSPFSVKDLLDDIDLLIERNNLQFVEHNVEEIKNGNFIEIKFNIFESEKLLVERINVLGNNVTNEDVIRGELLIDEGDPFTKLSLDKSISKIKSRGIFKKVVSETLDGTENNLKIININVEEKPTGEIAAGAGIGTNGGSFGFSITENNWLGKGTKLNFELDVDEESLGGTLNYTQPNYNFLGNSLNYFVSSQSNDKPDQGYENAIYSAGIQTGFEQYKDVFVNLGLSTSFDDLRTQDSASESLKKQSGEFLELAGNYGFKYDTRNRAFMPTSGAISSFNQVIPIYADKSFIDNSISISNYKSFSEESIVGSSKIFISAINGLNDDNVRLSKRKKLSSRRLRGFERGKVGPLDGTDHIGGNYAASLNLDANLPKLLPESSGADIALFLDVANVWGVDYDSTIDESNEIRSSTGLALNWMSPLGPMSFVLANDLSKADTDQTESFNFNLGTTF
tara:strand:+ start:10015 stop:12249 length:2235 start_codon:yes stop_codon:yes gene_type:complete